MEHSDKHTHQASILKSLRVLQEDIEKRRCDPPLASLDLLRGVLKKAKELGMDTTEFPRVQVLLKKYDS